MEGGVGVGALANVELAAETGGWFLENGGRMEYSEYGSSTTALVWCFFPRTTPASPTRHIGGGDCRLVFEAGVQILS